MVSDLKSGEYMGGTHAERRFQWWIDGLGAIQHGMVLGPGLSSNCAVDKSDIREAWKALGRLADELETEYVDLFDGNRPVRVAMRGGEIWLEAQLSLGDWKPVIDVVRDWNTVQKHTALVAAYRAGLDRRS